MDTQFAPTDTNAGLSLMQILAIARVYWWQTLTIWLVLTLALAVVLLLQPKTYTATVTLVVNASNDNTLAAQTPQIDRLGSYLAAQTELITSPVLLLPVVEQLGLTQDTAFTTGFAGDARALPDYVARRLSAGLKVEVSPSAQLVYVSASAGSPARAAQIANAVVEQYFVEGRSRAQGYAEQIKELQARVATAQANLAEYRTQKGIPNVSDLSSSKTDIDPETQALTTLEGKLLDAQNLRRSLEARAAGDPTAADESLASPQVQQLRTQLQADQSELAQLRTVYGPQHPKILALVSQIATTRQALSRETSTIRGDLSTELERARDLQAQYQQAVEQQRKKVLQLRDLQGQGNRLQLELDSAQSVYKDALAGYEQTMFSSVDKFTNLQVISRATPPVYPSKSKNRKYLAMGCLVALGFGFALPFGYELLIHRRLRCRDDLERGLGVRVLAHIGPIAPLQNHV
jgi:uncharacterized protein involved in exopolysaccharide biosynthesis